MSTIQIQCNLDQQFVLTPSQNGSMPGPNTVIVLIQLAEDPLNGKTGVISWSGAPRAYLTFDPSGRQVISYTMADQNDATQRSVENILPVL